MNKAAANAAVAGLETMLQARIGALADWQEKKLDHALDKANLYAAGVEGKNAEQREAAVTLATQASAAALAKAEILLKSMDAAIEIQRLRVQLSMLTGDDELPF